MRAFILVPLVVIGCATNTEAPSATHTEPTLSRESTVYLGAFAFNIANYHPAILKECIPISLAEATEAVDATVAEFEALHMTCERQSGYPSYTCKNEERGIIGRVDVWKTLPQCKEFPGRMTSDMKALFNQ